MIRLIAGAVVVISLLASTVYGLAPDHKEKMFPDSLARDIAACIQLSSVLNKALVGRAACILLCNMLAGCDANITKARAACVAPELHAC